MAQIATPFPEQPAVETIALDVSGMKCAGCVKAVEKQLIRQTGVVSACVNLVTKVARVECKPGAVDPDNLAQQLTNKGFPSQPRYATDALSLGSAISTAADTDSQPRFQQPSWQLAIAASLIILSSLGHIHSWGGPAIPGLSNMGFHCLLATVALAGPGGPILLDGWRGLRHNIPNMNTLVGLGTLAAYLASLVAFCWPSLGWECFFDEPVMLLGFILLGRTLEQRARGKTATAFQSLLALRPEIARLIAEPKDNTAEQPGIEIPVDRVRIGEWLKVLPGEKIPTDGELAIGQSTVDESLLTGESIPQLKRPGDLLTAGTLNQSGAIILKVTRTGNETTLAQMIALVEAAQTRKAPIQKLADTVAGYFAYGVMAVAAMTFSIWYFAGSHLWPQVFVAAQASPLLLSLKLAIAVLVVACPCALGLATPTAILVGSGIGAERGLFIRGGDVLERVHQLDTIIFDKTGTLTIGQPTLTDCLPTEAFSNLGQPSPPIAPPSNQAHNQPPSSPPARNPANASEQLLQIAATAESGTRHPLAQAIQHQAQQQYLALLAAEDFHTEPGLGISAQVAGQTVHLGTQGWLCQQGIEISATSQAQAEALTAAGKTVVHVSRAGQLAGLIATTDILRPDASQTIQKLQQFGLKVLLLTGDRQETATRIAQQLGLNSEQIFAEVVPQQKATIIAQLQAAGETVAMVGDGINDAAALAQADIGISMQAATDIAVEAAQIVLMRDRLVDVVDAIQLSRATFNKIRQNLFWALAYNALGIPIAAGALLPTLGIVINPAAAGAMMAFSSVSVVANSISLRRQFSQRFEVSDRQR